MKIYRYMVKMMICISIFLVLGIFCKSNISYKSLIYNKMYQDYWDFSSIKVLYDKYLGGIAPLDNFFSNGLQSVFNEKISYQNLEKYEEGVSLLVDYNYLVPIIESGVVVYVGDKDKYGKVVIVEGSNGIDIWYGNLENAVVNIYDVVEKGEYLGNVADNKLYLVFTKGKTILDYNDYLY